MATKDPGVPEETPSSIEYLMMVHKTHYKPLAENQHDP